MSDGQPRASRAGYWIGAALAVTGVLAGAAVLLFNFKALASDLERLERVPVPGRVSLTLPAGKHVVYLESSRGAPADSAIAVTVRAPGGARVPLEPYGTSFTYTSGSRSGRAAHTFVAERAGRYLVAADGPPASDLSVSVGPPLGSTVVSRVLGSVGGFGLLFGGPLVGGVAILVTALRRHRGRPATAPAGPVAGWHPDPWGQSRLRWWDGARWTEHTSA